MIERLVITNIKAFGSATLPMQNLTLLSGLNGSGKSTVLQSLAALRQSNDLGALPNDGLVLNGPLVEWGVGQDVLHEQFASKSAENVELGLELASQSDSSVFRFRYERSADLLRFSKPPINFDSCTGRLFGKSFQYIRADRSAPAIYYDRSYENTVRRNWLGVRGEYAADFLREHADRTIPPNARSFAKADSDLVSQTSAWLSQLCPGVDVNASGIDGTDLVRLHYGFGGTAGLSSSHRYRPTNVGFGLTYVLPVLLALLIGNDDSLILLENPEAHLHPRGQTLLGLLCAKVAASGAQVIVESHSDHFLNGIRLAVKSGALRSDLASILYFSRTSSDLHIDKPKILPSGRLDSWPSGFFDEWEQSLDRLLS